MQQYYQAIDNFFDAYSLPHALHMLAKLIKTADKEKIWKGACPANAIWFTERLELLTEAVFALQERYDYHKEVILDKDNSGLWMLNQYKTYCGWHRASAPWDFFPRHLSQKEFIDPYKVLKKFTKYRSLAGWKEILKDLRFNALSPHSISEFDDRIGIISIWLLLHKLLEAAHLIEVRMPDDEIKPRKKWKDKKPVKKKITP